MVSGLRSARVPDVAASEPTGAPPRRSWRVLGATGVALLVACSTIYSVAAALQMALSPSARGIPMGDAGLIEVQSIAVGRQFPLIGAYGRTGWGHPGPIE